MPNKERRLIIFFKGFTVERQILPFSLVVEMSHFVF